MNNKHIEVFAYYLGNLLALIQKIQIHSDDNAEILRARLTENMFPLLVQAEIAAGFALRACCPIAGVEVTSFAKQDKSFNSLKWQIRETIEYLQHLDSLENNLNIQMQDAAGPHSLSLPADDFLSRFALPNFYFHLSMVYAIARANGVPLSKGDFDGLHQYPPGFSFETVVS